MKPVNLPSLTIARLKAYRKSILAKVGGFEICDCGSLGCDHRKTTMKDIPEYIHLSLERDRVNKELARKQRLEAKQ
jgi:hypothetical protein